ncbi:class I SAM-dependent methyltransferase [Neobacillus sp. M.A.Huq-85]
MNTKLGIQIFGNVKNMLKEHRSSRRPIIKFGVSSLYFLRNSANTIRRFWFDKEFRSIVFMQLTNSKNVHQTTPYTYMDRYPVIFSACQNYLDGKQNLRILSYGCSTGEEVLTLRKYFPEAHIVGAEINKRSLKICRNLSIDDKITFVHSEPNEIQKHGPYDAIFCMAVLQRKPHYIEEKGIRSLKKIYPFEKFEEQILELDQLIKPEGLLIIHFTQYSFKDTAIASKYTALGHYTQGSSCLLFDKNSNLIKNPFFPKSIYKKQKR